MLRRNLLKVLVLLGAVAVTPVVLGNDGVTTNSNPLIWYACNDTCCDTGSKACTDSTQYAVFIYPAYRCGVNAWSSDCTNSNTHQICSKTVHYLGDCSTVNGTPSYTYLDECG